MNQVVLSSNRVNLLGKYLTTLSASVDSSEESGGGNTKTSTAAASSSSSSSSKSHFHSHSTVGTSAKRKRLHILYLLNDLLHHTKFHLDNSTVAFSTLSGSLQPYLVELFGYAASYDREKNPKHHRRLDEILDIWGESGFYSQDYVKKLREVVKNSALAGPIKASVDVEESNTNAAAAAAAGTTGRGARPDGGRHVPFIMPSMHGDPSTPYYDLPAGNLVPHMIPNSTVPLRPDSIKPLQFLAGPADEKLVTALTTFLDDVDRIYGEDEVRKTEDGIVDIDELGEPVVRDEVTGEIVNGETYYGWSREFCQQMKKRHRDWARSHSHSRSPGSSRSWSGSRGPSRSRRYSDSPGSDYSKRSWSRRDRRDRSPSYSRSRSPTRRRSLSQSRERSYSPRPVSPGRSFSPRKDREDRGQYGNPPVSSFSHRNLRI